MPNPSVHKGHRERLKARFLEEGLDNFTDIQALELLLFYSIPQKDTNPIGCWITLAVCHGFWMLL